MVGISEFSIGAIVGGFVVAIYAFMRGFFQHFGAKAATALLSWLLPDANTSLSNEELRNQTLELHRDLSEFQTRQRRQQSRNFWNQNKTMEEMDEETIIENFKQSSVHREELRGEFLKKYGPRLEMILQEYEKRDITPDEETKGLDSIRRWAQHGEVDRILPTLRRLPQKLDSESE